jgi:5-methyltetrahydropteroyltriglutamate--homocysteine methyltransferase
VFERFSEEDRARLGVHSCPGGDRDATHSADVDYAGLLPKLFQLKVKNFYLQMGREANRDHVLELVRKLDPAIPQGLRRRYRSY